MSDAEDEFVPDAATAQKLVKEFEGISNTDVAFAQCCLQVGNVQLCQDEVNVMHIVQYSFFFNLVT